MTNKYIKKVKKLAEHEIVQWLTFLSYLDSISAKDKGNKNAKLRK
jgi:hypothetical protein